MDWGRYGWDRAGPQYKTYFQVAAKHFTALINCTAQWCAVHTPHSKSTLHTPKPTVYTAHSTLYTAQCTLHTPHSTMQRVLCPKDRSFSWISSGGCLCSGPAVRIWALSNHVKNKLNIVHFNPRRLENEQCPLLIQRSTVLTCQLCVLCMECTNSCWPSREGSKYWHVASLSTRPIRTLVVL